MRNCLTIMVVIGTLLANGGSRAQQPANDVARRLDDAPIGHLQPRAPYFLPGTRADQRQQQNISKFDARQFELGRKLDNELNICRC